MHNACLLISRRPLYQHADPISHGGVQPIDNVLQPPNGGTCLKEATRVQGHEAQSAFKALPARKYANFNFGIW